MHKILIIDDNPGIIHLFEDLFSDKEIFQTETAATAFEGIKIFKREKPDLLILDLALPDKDGRYLLDELEKESLLTGCKVVLISGLAEEQETVSPLKINVDLFLAKPFDISQAAKQIFALLGLNKE